MPSRPLPNLLLQGFWPLGEDDWKDENDRNLLKLSVLVQASVSAKVAVEPGAPAAGTIIVLDETNAAHPNAVAVFDDGAWVYFTPTEGWLVYNRGTDKYLTYNSVAWVDLATGGGGGGAAKYRFGFSIESSAPVAGEVLLRHVVQTGVAFADDFAGSRARLSPGAGNPATAQTFAILHNGANVGSLAVAANGTITFSTTGGALAVAAGDEIRVEAPVAPDAALIGLSVTFHGLEV